MTGSALDSSCSSRHGLLHGQESVVFADAGYQGAAKREEATGVPWQVAMRPGKRRALDKNSPWAFSISSGYCAHDTMDWKDDKRVNCETEWILDNPVTLWPNGGGHSYRIENYILGTFDSDGWEDITESKMYCPECGDTLSPYSN